MVPVLLLYRTGHAVLLEAGPSLRSLISARCIIRYGAYSLSARNRTIIFGVFEGFG